MPRVLIADSLSPAAVEIFRQRGVDTDIKTGLTKEELIAVIGDSANVGSVGVHRKQGFDPVGVIKDCGWKFGEWRDIVLRIGGQRPQPEAVDEPVGERRRGQRERHGVQHQHKTFRVVGARERVQVGYVCCWLGHGSRPGDVM